MPRKIPRRINFPALWSAAKKISEGSRCSLSNSYNDGLRLLLDCSGKSSHSLNTIGRASAMIFLWKIFQTIQDCSNCNWLWKKKVIFRANFSTITWQGFLSPVRNFRSNRIFILAIWVYPRFIVPLLTVIMQFRNVDRNGDPLVIAIMGKYYQFFGAFSFRPNRIL